MAKTVHLPPYHHVGALRLIEIKVPALTDVISCRMPSDASDPPLCLVCREPMRFDKTIPHVGGLPEIFVFYCSRCKQAETKVQKRTAA